MSKCKYKDCVLWEPNMDECDDCVDGRFVGVVCEHASTCDGCAELTSHSLMTINKETQFGYCEKCTV